MNGRASYDDERKCDDLVADGADGGIIANAEPKWDRTTREFAELMATEDAKEGPLAGAEKRPPVWKAR